MSPADRRLGDAGGVAAFRPVAATCLPEVQALGIASFPTAERGRATSMASATTLLHGALRGLADR